jgi:ABC-2 type transport system ATP-binding protein
MRANELVRITACGLLLAALAGCGQEPAADPSTASSRAGATSTAGTSYDVMLSSDVDGEAIAITVHEPVELRAHKRYPLLIESHGYGWYRRSAASRETLPPGYKMLLEAGYAILTIDLRGHGESGGTARLLDPEYEGRDLVQILDWAEASLPWLDYRRGNLVLGAFGESYGGGMQLLLHRVDPKRRLDALVPDTTWHDLRRSLFEGGVFKSAYGVFFAAIPALVPTVMGGSTGARPDPLITEILATGVAANQLTETQLETLRQRSPVAACEDGTLPPVDVLFTQSAFDPLFTVNEAWDNVRCYAALGGDVRLWVKPATGHGLPIDPQDHGIPLADVTGGGGGGTPSQACGTRDLDAAVLAWFDEKLKGDRHAADAVPRACFHLGMDGTDSIVADGVDSGGLVTAVPEQTMVLQEGTATEIRLPLATLDGERVLAGIPRVSLQISDAIPGALEAGDPILFLGLALTRNGAVTPLNFYRAIRGYGAHEVELPAIFERLQPGDVVSLQLRSGSVGLYAGAASRTPTPVTVGATVALPVR